ncbi:MAG: class I SAM-dependent methyltransferase [Alphaproteobacteria bacterium]|nr:class I SAM-dependent methyltransferase [Alphaproteobacteria bacterium]
MTGFSADWLAMRAPFDDAARSPALARAFAALLPADPFLVDLGSGSGAARRALAPILAGTPRWTLLDNDPALLRQALVGGTRSRAVKRHLNSRVDDILDMGHEGVTAFSLLDLGGLGWIGRLARSVARRGLPFYAPLIVDGRIAWSPADPDDRFVIGLFAAHQRRAKGLGPALGAAAPAWTARAFRRCGYRVASAPSDWRIPANGRPMLAAMIAGAEAAATEQSPAARGRIAAWAARRRDDLAAGRLSLTVGHRDLLAWRPGNEPAGHAVSRRTGARPDQTTKASGEAWA